MTKFADWAAQLERDGIGPEDMPAITRGLPHTVVWSPAEDYSADTFRLELFDKPDGTLLATYTSTVGAFSGGVTPITFTLLPSDQGSLPADTDGDGIESVPFHIVRDPAVGQEYRILGGFQPISGGVPA